MLQKNIIPPKLANRFLCWFLRDELLEEVQGDLEEQFRENLERVSPFRTKIKYWFQVLNYLRPFAISKSTSAHFIHYAMFRNYFKIGWRNLLHQKGYSFINISGLAVGMAVAILIGLWVWDELSFNKNYENYPRIAQVMRSGKLNEKTFTFPYLPYALGDELKNAYGSSFKHVLISSLPGEHILAHKDTRLFREGTYVDKGWPEMLSLKMIKGTSKGLEDMHSVLISSSTALAFFGKEDPLEKTLTIDNNYEVQITGVYEDLPPNSDFHELDFFAPWELYVSKNDWIQNMGFKDNFLNIFVEIDPNTNFTDASFHIKDAIFNNILDIPEMVKVHPQIHLHPMSRWHLFGEWENGLSTGGLIKFVWIFGIVGVFVLLLACINFMNLSTARSEKRAKEVGIRKVIGSLRGQLMAQFFTESFLMVSLAFVLSILLVVISMGWFNDISGKQLLMPWSNTYFWLICIVFIIVTGFTSGSYPALYLSSFNPLKALKGTNRLGRNAGLPRKILVIIQFTFSVSMIIGTLIVFQQVQFVKDRPVGYDSENLLMIQMTTEDFYTKYEALETELKNSSAVAEVSRSLSPVTGVWSSNGGFSWPGMDPGWQQEDFATLSVTPDYGSTVGWQFTDGRDFNKNLASDSSAFVITESAARVFGFDNALGEVIDWNYTNKKYTVIGVIKDMVMESPFSTPMPTVFYQGGNLNWINIRINAGTNTSEALSQIESVFQKIIPEVPFSYLFADQEYASKFVAEVRIGKLSSIFTLLAVFISCLGLFGLASYVAEQRTKEIGIRKILGASAFYLWKLLSKDFILMVLIACFIAIPLTYYFMNDWLKSYEYKVEISIWIFILSSLGAALITLVTVSFQTLKSAFKNPVDSLRSE